MANYLTTDTDLEAVADAIRTKGGTSADLVFPQGFVDAIDAIETGGGISEWVPYVVRLSNAFRQNNQIPDEFEVYAPNANVFDSAFWGIEVRSQKKITIKSDVPITNLASVFNCLISANCVITIDADLSHCSNYTSAFAPRASGHQHAKTIVANIDFSSVTANLTNMFSNNNYVESITFVPNTMGYNFSIPVAPNLTTETLVSLANCLKAAAKTLTLHATPKGKLSTIMGTVTNNGSYDLFTEDAQGQTTLLDFITSTKGWTVA